MKLKLIAKLDRKGSEAAKSFHYTFGRHLDDVRGGVYIKKSAENPPDEIEIEIAQVKGDSE